MPVIPVLERQRQDDFSSSQCKAHMRPCLTKQKTGAGALAHQVSRHEFLDLINSTDDKKKNKTPFRIGSAESREISWVWLWFAIELQGIFFYHIVFFYWTPESCPPLYLPPCTVNTLSSDVSWVTVCVQEFVATKNLDLFVWIFSHSITCFKPPLSTWENRAYWPASPSKEATSQLWVLGEKQEWEKQHQAAAALLPTCET